MERWFVGKLLGCGILVEIRRREKNGGEAAVYGGSESDPAFSRHGCERGRIFGLAFGPPLFLNGLGLFHACRI